MNYNHPLLKKAQRYSIRKVNLSPDGCWYDEFVGAWKFIDTGELWVNTSSRIGPHTKKADIETGEDQKGE